MYKDEDAEMVLITENVLEKDFRAAVEAIETDADFERDFCNHSCIFCIRYKGGGFT